MEIVSHISKLPSALFPDWGFMNFRGVGAPSSAGMVLLYLKMFSYLILCPVRVPSSTVWLGPMFLLFPVPLTIWCSSWLQMLPATLLSQCPVSFHLFMLLLLKPVQFPFPWLLLRFFFFYLVFCGRLRRIFLVAASDGIRMGRKPNCLYMKGNALPKPFLDRTVLLICLSAVSCFISSHFHMDSSLRT